MLKISKLTDYGLLASVYLARRRGETISAREISKFYSLPGPVISKVLKTLHEGGVVVSRRGVGGGYSFEGEPDSVTLGQLLEIFEGPWSLLDCETNDESGTAVCGIRSACPSRTFIGGINRTIKNAFQQVTLGDLARGVDTNAGLQQTVDVAPQSRELQ